MYLMKWSYNTCTLFVHSVFKLYHILSDTRKIKVHKKRLINVDLTTFISVNEVYIIIFKTLYKTLKIPVVGIIKSLYLLSYKGFDRSCTLFVHLILMFIK